MKKLESIVIDIPNKVFEINHTPIGENCSNLSIEYKNGVWSITSTDKYLFDGTALRNELSDKISEFH